MYLQVCWDFILLGKQIKGRLNLNRTNRRSDQPIKHLVYDITSVEYIDFLQKKKKLTLFVDCFTIKNEKKKRVQV